MARIAVLTDQITDESLQGLYSFEIIQALIEQNHKVKILTSYMEPIPELPSINAEIFFLLKHGSSLEIIKVFKILFHFKPEIILVIQFSHNQISKMAWLSLFKIAPHFFKNMLLIFSFLDVTSFTKKNKIYLSFLKSFKSITVCNRLQQRVILKSLPPSVGSRVTVLPPVFPNRRLDSKGALFFKIPDDFYSRFIVVPGPLKYHFDLDFLFELISVFLENNPGVGILIMGSWEGISHRKKSKLLNPLKEKGLDHYILFTGLIDDTHLLKAINKNTPFLLSTLPSESLIFHHFFYFSLRNKMIPIITQSQGALYPEILKSEFNTLITLLEIKPQLKALELVIKQSEIIKDFDPILSMFSDSNRDDFSNSLNRLLCSY